MGTYRSGGWAKGSGGLIRHPLSQYYGRRNARRLTGARVDSLLSALARYEVVLPEEGCMPAFAHPIWLEIGFGSGEHLLELARRYPHKHFIGCEPFLNGVAVLVRELQRNNMGNVRIFPEDARLLLKALPGASVERAYVLFADPWPKLRHNRRRMINHETLDEFARVMTMDGNIFLATDDAPLAEWYCDVVGRHPAFSLYSASDIGPHTRPVDWPETRYERKALAAGRHCVYFRISRI